MKTILSMITTFIIIIFGGCATTSTTQLGGDSSVSKPEDCEIQVFTVEPKDRQFEELCLVSARGGQSIFEGKSVADLIPQMKKKACACGADAIIIRTSKEGGYNFGGAADRAEASATAIRFIAKANSTVNIK